MGLRAEPETGGVGLEWFAVLAEPLALAAEPGSCVEALEEDCVDLESEIEVYCDRPPSLSSADTLEALTGLLALETAQEAGPRYCALRGETLHLPSGSSVAEESAGRSTRFARTSEVWYRLIVTDAETPVGFCTWVLQCHASADGEMQEIPVAVEIGEVWLASQYRGLGLARVIADRIVRLLAQTLLELDGRLVLDFPVVRIEVGADVYSESGADFVRRVAGVAREQLTSVMGTFYGEFSRISPDVLPASVRT